MQDDLIFEGKKYISSRRAAKLRKYSQDYVGQLIRDKKIEARMVGRSWFVSEESILSYKRSFESKSASSGVRAEKVLRDAEPALKYLSDDRSFLPELRKEIVPEEVRFLPKANFPTVRQKAALPFIKMTPFADKLVAASLSLVLLSGAAVLGNGHHAKAAYKLLSSIGESATEAIASALDLQKGSTEVIGGSERSLAAVGSADESVISKVSSAIDRMLNRAASFFASLFGSNKIATEGERTEVVPANNASEEANKPVAIAATTQRSADTTSSSVLKTEPATTTIVQNYYTNVAGVGASYVDARLAEIKSVLQSRIGEINSNAVRATENARNSREAGNTSRIDKSSIRNSTITGSTITDSAIDATSLNAAVGSIADLGFTNASGTNSSTTNATSTNLAADLLSVSGSIKLASASPADTVNRLYANGTDLYWAGNVISGATTGTWASDGTNAWRATGNVGIGTTSPAQALSVQGNGLFSGNISAANITATGTVATQFASTTSITSTGYAAFATAGGNVGIGTALPQSKLAVQTTSGTVGLEVSTSASGSGTGLYVTPNASDVSIYASGNAPKSMIFYTGNTEVMRYDTVGRVGIGQTPSTEKLEVFGNVRALGIMGMSGDGSAFNNSIYLARFANDTTNNPNLAYALAVTGGTNASGGGRVGIGTSSPLARLDVAGVNNQTNPLLQVSSVSSFATTTRFIVDSSGNVGVGTTTPTKTLSVAGSFQQANSTIRLASTTLVGATTVYGASAEPSSLLESDGRYLYFLDTAGNIIKVYSTASSTGPVLLGTSTATSLGNPTGIRVQGKYAYVSSTNFSGGFVDIYDVSNPAAITKVSSTNIGGWPWTIEVFGRYMATAQNNGQFRIYDVSNPASPVLLTTSSSSTNGGLASFGNTLFAVGLCADKLRSFDLSDPSNITSSTLTIAGGCNVYNTNSIAVRDQYAYIASNVGTMGISVVDVSNPANMSMVSIAAAGAGTNQMILGIHGNYLYTYNQAAGTTLLVWDLSNPLAPTLARSLSIGYVIEGVRVIGNTMFVVGGSSGTYILTYDLGGATIESAQINDARIGRLNAEGIAKFSRDVVVTGTGVFNRGVQAYGPSAFYYNPSTIPALQVSTVGLIGVATTSPTDQFAVAASGLSNATARTADFAAIYASNLATSTTASIIKSGIKITSTGTWSGTNASNVGLYVSSVTGGTNNFDAIFNGGGNVGVGTTSPAKTLSVQGNGLFSGNVSAATVTATGTLSSAAVTTGDITGRYLGLNGGLPGETITNQTAALSVIGFSFLNGLRIAGGGGQRSIYSYNGGELGIASNGGDVTFSTDGSGATTMLAVKANTGKVGIGTTSPSTALHVEKSNAAAGVVTIANDSSSGYSSIDLRNNGNLQVAGFGYGNTSVSNNLLNNRFYTYTNAKDIVYSLDNGSTGSMILTSGGNLGIGTTSPATLMSISGTGLNTGFGLVQGYFTTSSTEAGLYLSNTGTGGRGYNIFSSSNGSGVGGGNFVIGDVTASAARLTISSAGNLRLNAYGAGTLTTDSSGNVTASSDERLKDIQGAFTRGLAELKLIRPIIYHWNAISTYDTSTQYAGFSAQNIQAAIPEAVGIDPRGYLTLSDRPIIAATVNAIQELNLSVETLVTRMNAIEGRVAALEAVLGVDQIGAASTTSATSTVAAWLASVGIAIDSIASRVTAFFADSITSNFVVINNTLSVQTVNAQTVTSTELKVGTSTNPSAAGITILDRITGQPFCFFIANGVMQNQAGECNPAQSITVSTQAPETIPVEAGGTASQSNGTAAPEASGISATSTESVPVVEPAATSTSPVAATTPIVDLGTSTVFSSTSTSVTVEPIATSTENVASSTPAVTSVDSSSSAATSTDSSIVTQ